MVLASSPVVSDSRLAGPTGWGRQQRRYALGAQNGQDGADDRSLADARSAGDDQHLRRQGLGHRVPLSRCQGHAEAGFDPINRLLGIDARPRRFACPQVPDGQRDGVFRMTQMRQEHARLAVDAVGQHECPAISSRQVLQQRAINLEQLLGEREQLVLGQTAVAILDRLQQGIGDAGPRSQH